MKEELGAPKKLKEPQLLGRLRADGTAVDLAEVREVEGSEQYISNGKWGIVSAKRFKDEDGAELTLVEKQLKVLVQAGMRVHVRTGEFTPEHIRKTLEVHRVLKNAGVKTLDTLLSDGKAFYSTMLNTNGKVALSHLNPAPKMSDGGSYTEMLGGKLRIANVRVLCEQLVDNMELALDVGVALRSDSIFYLVPDGYEGEEFDMDFIIGDFDELKIKTSSDKNKDKTEAEMKEEALAKVNRGIAAISSVKHATRAVVRQYTDGEYVEEYLKTVDDVLDAKMNEFKRERVELDPESRPKRGVEGRWGGI